MDYANFNFGDRLNDYIHEVMKYGGAPRTESEPTEGQEVFLRAVKRERVKYINPDRQGYANNLFQQLESFTRTLGDLHNSYFDAGMRKVSDCLYNRWKMLFEGKKRAASGGGRKTRLVSVIKNEAKRHARLLRRVSRCHERLQSPVSPGFFVPAANIKAAYQ